MHTRACFSSLLLMSHEEVAFSLEERAMQSNIREDFSTSTEVSFV
jgi:hypothetical protein